MSASKSHQLRARFYRGLDRIHLKHVLKVHPFPGGRFVVIPNEATWENRKSAKALTDYLNTVEVMIEIERAGARAAQKMLDAAIKAGKL